jgi:hypothetical protein
VTLVATFVGGPVDGQKVELDPRDALRELHVAVEPEGRWQVTSRWPPDWTSQARLYRYVRDDGQEPLDEHRRMQDTVLTYTLTDWPDAAVAT